MNKNIQVLHICSYFNTSKLYKNLFERLEQYGLEQTVFIPMYKTHVQPRHSTVQSKEMNTNNTQYIYTDFLDRKFRYLLLYRSNLTYKELTKKVNFSDISFIHAHSFFYNGLVAHMAHQDTGIQYIVAFRQTDLSVYKKLPYAKIIMKKILDSCSKIIFISHSLKNKLMAIIKDQKILSTIKKKAAVIPNGVEERYLNEVSEINQDKETYNFLYQGSFIPRKNILYSLSLVYELNKKKYPVSFSLYGDGPEKKKIEKYISDKNMDDIVKVGDWTNDCKEILYRYKSSHVFIMPSFNETFGISYLESLALKRPIIYMKGEGVSGFFTDNSALELTYDFDEDVGRIEEFLKKYFCLKFPDLRFFSWDKIALEYLKLYKRSL